MTTKTISTVSASVVHQMEEIEDTKYPVVEAYKGHTIEIIQDEDAESPREWDNLGTMICFHRRYDLGDKHNYNSDCYGTLSDVVKAVEADEGPIAVIKPLYLFDHSDISISPDNGRFKAADSAGWDWGTVGFIYITKAKVREEYGVKRISSKLRERVSRYLANEVQTYDDYLRGMVYGYVIKDELGEEVEDGSCWGFYPEHNLLNGRSELEYVLQEAKEIIDYRIRKEVESLGLDQQIC